MRYDAESLHKHSDLFVRFEVPNGMLRYCTTQTHFGIRIRHDLWHAPDSTYLTSNE